METPSSMRRQTRSQARKGGRQEEAPERSALLDITNDSPVVGLKVGSFAEKATTPTSAPAAKAKAAAAVVRTPGSGEALLRKQVKFLLQKVEEETELVVGAPPPPPGEQCCPAFRALISHLRSPAQLLAPTPANTPVLKEEDAAAMCETVLLHHGRHEVEFRSAKEDEVFEQKANEHHHVDGAMISRALQFDSPQKPESCNSPDGSCSSAWSLQVNCSTKLEEEEEDDDDDEGEEEVEQVGYYVGEEDEEDEEEEEVEVEWFDVLCEGMKKVSLLEEATGKHTRFVYDSDGDEIVAGEEEVTRAVVLKGMPAPQGKHIRFQEEEEEYEEEEQKWSSV